MKKDTMWFVLIKFGGHAVQVQLVAVQCPGIIALSFWLVPICILHERRDGRVVLKFRPKECLPWEARQSPPKQQIWFVSSQKRSWLFLSFCRVRNPIWEIFRGPQGNKHSSWLTCRDPLLPSQSPFQEVRRLLGANIFSLQF